MLKLKAFAGINNTLPERAMGKGDLVRADNVDLMVGGALRRRAGFTQERTECWGNLWHGAGFMLATDGLQRLMALHEDGTVQAIAPGMGSARIWYVNLPTGVTLFSNGLVRGATDGCQLLEWGVEPPVLPEHLEVQEVGGQLPPGLYLSAVTLVRLSDGLESAPSFGPAVQLSQGGVRFAGLPQREDCKACLYLSTADGEAYYLAGTCTDGVVDFRGDAADLQLPCRTVDLAAPPAGTLLALWRGRVLVAQGNVLWASMPGTVHHFDMGRDFKQLRSLITMVQPVDGGIFVGTTTELVFLAGDSFDALTYSARHAEGVTLGSGVHAPGERVWLGKMAASGTVMMCLCGGKVCVGFGDGGISLLTLDQYQASAKEVCAVFREVDGTPQYVAQVLT